MKRIGFKIALFYALVLVCMLGLMLLEGMIMCGMWFGIFVWVLCVVCVVVSSRLDLFADVYDWHDRLLSRMFGE